MKLMKNLSVIENGCWSIDDMYSSVHNVTDGGGGGRGHYCTLSTVLEIVYRPSVVDSARGFKGNSSPDDSTSPREYAADAVN